jgi:CheY-like chemotaxis protein
MILYLAADLMWSSKIRSTGDELGISMRPVRSLEMLEARLADSPVRAVVLDLEVPEVAMQIIQRLRGERASPTERAIRIVAWAPHVEVERMKAAEDAGADTVMPRGAFSSKLPMILQTLMGPA